MSKKNLLNEATVRRFMTLASLEPIGNTFIKERFNFEEDLTEVEEDVIEEEHPPEEEFPPEEAPPTDEFPPEEAPEEEEPAPEASPELETFAREVAQSLADAIEQASHGAISVSVEGGAEEGVPPGEEEAPMDLEAPPEEEAPMDLEAPPEEEEEEELEEDTTLNLSLTEEEEERIVNEVFKKLAKKILKEKLTSK